METALPSSPTEAKLVGLRRYFTGRPCQRRGHIAERRVSDLKCIECSREDCAKPSTKSLQRAWKLAHYEAPKDGTNCRRCGAVLPERGRRQGQKRDFCNDICCDRFNAKQRRARLKLSDEERLARRQERLATEREQRLELAQAEGRVVDCSQCGKVMIVTESRRKKAVSTLQFFCTVGCMHAYQRANAASPREVRLNDRMRWSIRVAMKKRGMTKAGVSWCELAGYTVVELISHIERQFTKRMSWKNMDKWHIDHIIALATFKFTDVTDPEFKAAWALPNLRPMWGPENVSKGTTRTLLL